MASRLTTDFSALYDRYVPNAPAGGDRPTNRDSLWTAVLTALDTAAPTDPPAGCSHVRHLAQVLGYPGRTPWNELLFMVAALMMRRNGYSGPPYTGTTHTGCPHPREVACILNSGQEQPWDDSMEIIATMLRLERAGGPNIPHSTSTTGGGTGRLPFSIDSIPAFENGTEIMVYRRTLRDFCATFAFADRTLVPNIMFAIKSRITNTKLSDVAATKDATDWVQPANCDLATAHRNYITWFDQQMISSQQEVHEEKMWHEMKKLVRGCNSAQDFMLLFEATLGKHNEARDRVSRPRLTDSAVTDHFVEALPNDIALALRPFAPNLATAHFRTYRLQLDQQWALVRGYKPPKTLLGKTTRAFMGRNDGPEESSEEEAGTYAGRQGPPRKKMRQGVCRLGKKLDDAPPVPRGLRGTIRWTDGNSNAANKEAYERLLRVTRAMRCAKNNCRRTKAEHDTGFIEPGPWNGPEPRTFLGTTREIPETTETPEDQQEEEPEEDHQD